MITLSSIIQRFEHAYLNQYRYQTLPSQHKALAAMKVCRTVHNRMMRVCCDQCEHASLIPHSCGNRHCPHCQHHESQQWLERQLQKQVPAKYFLLTFTIPKELRTIAWQNQRKFYDIMAKCSWDTVRTFSQNDKTLQGIPGAVSVIHTHSRRLDYHPHIHLVMPAAAIDHKQRLWHTKKGYLFNHKALAKVFRAKMLNAMQTTNMPTPSQYPKHWVVDVKAVGSGKKALTYLGRYLYKGVIQEKDIISCDHKNVTFRYIDSKTKRYQYKTLPGAKFLRLILQHVLPKGFRRARNFGFLHPNSKRLILLLQYLLGIQPKRPENLIKPRPSILCRCCGGIMKIVQTRIAPISILPSVLRSASVM